MVISLFGGAFLIGGLTGAGAGSLASSSSSSEDDTIIFGTFLEEVAWEWDDTGAAGEADAAA
jgi:hypothetical protein